MSVNEKMTAIADAIREKTGGTDPLTLDAMAEAIAGIETGGGGASGIVLVDETVTLANNATSANTSIVIFQSEKLKNLEWYFALFVKLNPNLASGAYEVVQYVRNSNYQTQATRWTGSGYSGNHAFNYMNISANGEVSVNTNNVNTMPLLAGTYRLIVIV